MSFLLKANSINIGSSHTLLPPAKLRHCYSVLNNNEREQVARFTHIDLKNRYIQAHGLLRFLLADYLNCKPESLVFKKTTQGKPYLSDYPQLQFNISHSNDYLLIATAQDIAVGVDIEHIKTRKTIENLVLRCCAIEEQAYWFALPQAEKLRAFYQFWTRKEAFVKATGLGIVLGLNQCVINPLNPNYFLAIPEQCGLVNEWRLMDLTVDVNYCATVVAKTSDFELVQSDLMYLI